MRGVGHGQEAGWASSHEHWVDAQSSWVSGWQERQLYTLMDCLLCGRHGSKPKLSEIRRYIMQAGLLIVALDEHNLQGDPAVGDRILPPSQTLQLPEASPGRAFHC